MDMYDLIGFNTHFGFIDGIVRGYKAGLLTAADFHNLTQCELLDGKLPFSAKYAV
jgi:V-type H+-transporting ATPase subunit d